MISTFHVNLQFMVLLVLRHTLPIIISGAGDYTMTLFMVRLGSPACSSFYKNSICFYPVKKKKTKIYVIMQLMILRTVGILLPIYVMVRAFTAIQHRRRQQQVSED
jgi:type III secretory pathway component EscR